MKVTCKELVRIARDIPETEFTPQVVREALTGVELADSSLGKYVHFRPRVYTRNQVYRDDTFELLVVCWEVSTTSPIHNHAGQDCFMYVHQGALCLEDFELADEHHRGRVGEGIKVVRSGRTPRAEVGQVDHRGFDNEIHRVINCRSFGSRAISIHLYARPIDQCIIYETRHKRAFHRELAYHSIDGHLL